MARLPKVQYAREVKIHAVSMAKGDGANVRASENM